MKKTTLIAVLLLAAAAPGLAQLTVIDPTSIRQQIQQLVQMQKQLVQLQQTYALYQQQYNLLNNEAQSLKGLEARYRYTFSNWPQFVAGNQYANTGAWMASLNTGQAGAVQNGYRQLVSPVQAVDVTLTPQAQQDWRQQYGLLQLQDAAIMDGMKTVGDAHMNVQQNTQTLARLESDATNPTLQDAKQVQQKTLIAILLMIRNLQDTNRMLAASINLQLQQQAQQRWERGRQVNADALDRQSRQARQAGH